MPSEVGVRADHLSFNDADHRADVLLIETDSISLIGPISDEPTCGIACALENEALDARERFGAYS